MTGGDIPPRGTNWIAVLSGLGGASVDAFSARSSLLLVQSTLQDAIRKLKTVDSALPTDDVRKQLAILHHALEATTSMITRMQAVARSCDALREKYKNLYGLK